MRLFIAGGAGFIGSNLAERLVEEGHAVTVFDNFSVGSREFLQDCQGKPGFSIVADDLLDFEALNRAIRSHEAVFHLAANSNIPEGMRKTNTDLRLGTLATYNLLEATRLNQIPQLIFASSSVVYGEPTVVPTPEDYGPLLPISLYGASKLACEGLISAFCHNYGLQAWIFRFANICGRHGTHGAIVDFIHKLGRDPSCLEVLGDGKQAKPYLHVHECVDGMLFGWRNSHDPLNYFNLGCEGATEAGKIARWTADLMGLPGAKLAYTGTPRGWPGDVPQVRLDCRKLKGLGWEARLTCDEAVKLAINELVQELACRSLS
jgi:UDP-glucose 4-epimerase